MQNSTVSVEKNNLFCHLYYFPVTITIFLVTVTKLKLPSEDCNFYEVLISLTKCYR